MVDNLLQHLCLLTVNEKAARCDSSLPFPVHLCSTVVDKKDLRRCRGFEVQVVKLQETKNNLREVLTNHVYRFKMYRSMIMIFCT
jgi:hypothetical protein